MTGAPDLSFLPANMANNLQVFYGLNAAMFTGNKLGGTINLKKNFEKQTEFFLQTSFNTLLNFNQSLGFNSKNFLALGGMTCNKNRFSFVNIAKPDSPKEIHQAPSTSYNFLLKKNFFLHKTKITTGLLALKSKGSLFPIMSYSGPGRTEILSNTNFLAFVKFSRNLHPGKKIVWQSSVNFLKNAYFLGDSVFTGINQTGFLTKNNSFNTSKAFYNELQFRLENWKFYVFFNYFSVRNFDSVLNSGYEAKRLETTISSRYQITLSKLKISLFSKLIVLNLNSFLPIIFVSMQQRNFSLEFGKNAQVPSLNDLYWIPGGNDSLLPEKSLFVKFSFLKKMKILRFKTMFFANSIKDWIQWKPTAFGYWTAQNVPQTMSLGFNTSVNASFKSGKNSFSLALSYRLTKTYRPGINNAFKYQMPYIPLHNANAVFQWERNKLAFVLTNSFTGKCYTSTDNKELFALKPYFLTNLFVSYATKKVTLGLRVENLFNVTYYTVLYRPMPGRIFGFSVKFIPKKIL